MLLNLCLFLVLGYCFLLRPLRQEFSRVREMEFSRDVYLFQLQQVRKHYPILRDLSYEEIHERYDVPRSYNSIR